MENNIIKPDFSGTWELDLKRSNLQSPPPKSMIFDIDHKEPNWAVKRTFVYESGEKNVWDELIGKTIQIPGALYPDNTPMNIKVETIVMAYTHAILIINNLFLLQIADGLDLCKRKSMPKIV